MDPRILQQLEQSLAQRYGVMQQPSEQMIPDPSQMQQQSAPVPQMAPQQDNSQVVKLPPEITAQLLQRQQGQQPQMPDPAQQQALQQMMMQQQQTQQIPQQSIQQAPMISQQQQPQMPMLPQDLPSLQPDKPVDEQINPEILKSLEERLNSKYNKDLRPAEQQQAEQMQPMYKSGTESWMAPIKNIATKMAQSPAGSSAIQQVQGIAEGAERLGQNLKQTAMDVGVGLNILDPQELTDYTAKIKQRREEQEKVNPGGGVGRFIGENIPYFIPIGGAAGLAGRMAQGALTGAAAMGTGYVPEGESRLAKTVTGAAVGGAITGAGTLLPKTVKSMFAKPLDQAVDDMATAAKAGIKPTVGQVTGNKVISQAEQGLKYAPIVGTKASLGRQYEQAQSIAKQLVRENKSIKNINNAILKDIHGYKANIELQADDLYNKFSEAAKKTGRNIDLQETAKTINMKEAQLLGKQSWKGFTSDSIDPAIARINNLKQSIIAHGKTTSPENLKILRSELLEASRDTKGLEQDVVKSISKALNNDLDRFAKDSGSDVYKAYRTASEFYKENVVPFKADKQLKKLLDNNWDLDTTFKSFIANNKPGKAEKLLDKLQPATKEGIQAKILNDAYDKSLDQISKEFNLKTFIKEINKLGSTKEAVFTEPMKNKLKGFGKLLSVIKPEAAPEWFFFIRGGGAVATGALAVNYPYLAVATAALSKALVSPTTSKILLKAAKMDPNSRALKQLLTTLTVTILKGDE